MLWICNTLSKFAEFKEHVRSKHDCTFLDLSKLPCDKLADEAESIVEHHKQCVVFLGYLEPGWMLELTHQTRIRKLFRKFPVGVVTHFVDSLPFSWKNEIEIFYSDKAEEDGEASPVNNGSSV